MKKILLLFSIGIMLMTFTACNSGDKSTSFSEIKWSEIELASLLPEPESNIGSIELESPGTFIVYIGETSKDKYEAYVSACKEKGFTVDYNKGNDYYYADNKDGYNLSLMYEDNNTMYVSIIEPNKNTSTEDTNSDNSTEPTDTTVEGGTTELVDGMRPEFKEAMNSYEAFFDEYCEFMKKYSESDNPVGMLSDYTEYMNKYTDAMGKMSEIGSETMSNEELQYYTEVMARISEKLVNVSTQ